MSSYLLNLLLAIDALSRRASYMDTNSTGLRGSSPSAFRPPPASLPVPPSAEPRMMLWTQELCLLSNEELDALYALPSPEPKS